MFVEEQAIGDGWYRCMDRMRRQVGRYCDCCKARIADEEVFYSKGRPSSTTFGANPAPDYCGRCYPAARAGKCTPTA